MRLRANGNYVSSVGLNQKFGGIQAALKGIRPAVIGMIFTAAIVVAQTAQIHSLEVTPGSSLHYSSSRISWLIPLLKAW